MTSTMLDKHLHPRLKPLLNRTAQALDKPGISADGITLGFAIGVWRCRFWRWAGTVRRWWPSWQIGCWTGLTARWLGGVG
jgi:hypothetical protein